MEDAFATASQRSDMLLVLIEKLFNAKNTDRESVAIRGALELMFKIVAKYQAPDDEFVDTITIEEIERDMFRLVSLSMNTGIASTKYLTGSKHFYSLGKKKAAEAFLQAKSTVEGDGGTFSAAKHNPIMEQIKGMYGIKSARAEAEGTALEQVTEIADKLCQVLKKIHDRKTREKLANIGT